MYFQKTVILFCLILYLSTAQNCLQRSEQPSGPLQARIDIIPNFQSGNIRFRNANTVPKRYNLFNLTLPKPFNTSYDVALSIQNIDPFKPTDGLDFLLTAERFPTYLRTILIMDVTSMWSQAVVSYAASARKDFAVGFFAANSAALMYVKQGQNAKIHHHLPYSFENHDNFIYAVPFICGARTYDQYLKFGFVSAEYKSSKNILELQISISYEQFPLESLYISYLIFNMASQLQVTNLVDISQIPPYFNSFLGMSFLDPVKPILVPVLQATPGQKQAFNMIFGINGIVVQSQRNFDLLYLPLPNNSQRTLKCVSKASCTSQGGVMIYKQEDIYNIYSECQICMENAKYDTQINDCKCKQGFQQQNGQCVSLSNSCRNNQQYSLSLKKCICIHLFVQLNDKCVSIYNACQRGFIFFQGKCIKIVTPEHLRPNCKPDQLSIRGQCVIRTKCTANMQLNITTNVCECPPNSYRIYISIGDRCVQCSKNETLTGNKCACKSGFYRIQGRCLQCSLDGHFNGAKCVCLTTFEGDGFTCKPQDKPATSLKLGILPQGDWQQQQPPQQ